jgi:hypothetical protein
VPFGLVVGTNRTFKARNFDPYTFLGYNIDKTQPLEIIYNPANFDSSKIIYVETTSLSDAYTANENLYASYLSFDVPISKLRIVAGLRFEYSEQKLNSYSRASNTSLKFLRQTIIAWHNCSLFYK